MDQLLERSRKLRLLARGGPFKFVTGMRHTVDPASYCPPHSHTSLEIVYHPVGIGETRLPDRSLSVPFQNQSVVIYDPGEVHDQRVQTDGEDFCVQIALPAGCRLFPQGCLHLPGLEAPALIEDFRLLSQGYGPLREMEQTAYDFRATAVLFALIDFHCAQARREVAPPSERYVLKAEEYIREHLLELRDVSEVAKAVGISSHYLRHLFKAQRGKSLIRHINEMRIVRAKALLSHSRVPLKQIASLCGFADEYYFSTTFRALTGHSPGGYRKPR